MRALIIGCGYLGRRAAAIWMSQGSQVSALTRTAENAAAMKKLGIAPILGDVLQPGTLSRLPEADVVLYAVGFDKRSGISKRDVTVGGLENVCREMAPRTARFVYVSSTSVYGQDAGEWVDESSPCTPSTADGVICLAAEQVVGQYFSRDPNHAARTAAVVLRFSGIYGPGRLLRRVESLWSGEPIGGNPEGFLNLIHVDDGARLAVEAGERQRLAATYIVTDDKPVRRGEYYRLLAALIGAPDPIFQLNQAEASRLGKRCSNARVRAELGAVLRFSSTETGLAHALAGGA